jgi:NAD+ diphosphatase
VGPPAFTGAAIDRAAELRKDPARIAELMRSPRARAVAASADSVFVEDGALARRPISDGAPAPLLLGLENGAPLFATEAGCDARLVPLREAGATLPQAEGGLAAYLVALLGWHRRHRFCANCGTPTEVAEAGFSRACPSCGAHHFPRTDPVVIMLVEHDGRLLLGRRPTWPENRYSLLAGFVSPAETPEEAVVREVREESGIEAVAPRYVASQPWPFPASLMLGFHASSSGGRPRARDGELADVRWVDRVTLAGAAREEGELRLPPPVSIARTLIDGWLESAT